MRYDRFAILMRDGFKCGYCQKTLTNDEFEIDHCFPKSMGGSDNPENLTASCRTCNRQKQDKLRMPYVDIEEQYDEIRGLWSTWYVHRRFGDWSIKYHSSGAIVLEFEDWYFIDTDSVYDDDWISHVGRKDWGTSECLKDLSEGLRYFRRMLQQEKLKKNLRAAR